MAERGQVPKPTPVICPMHIIFRIVAPKWFRQKYQTAWQNLERNAHRLTTPFDIYSTLKALLDWREPIKANLSARSLSLWDEIPSNRGCSEAGVEPHWCVCLNWQPVDVNSEAAAGILARAVVQAINDETQRSRKLCASLRLKVVLSAKTFAPHPSVLRYKAAKDKDGFVPDLSGKTNLSFALYQLRLKTSPGDAIYEATLAYDQRGEHQITLNLDDVSHINKFGDLPHCIIDKDYFLAKWCVCYDKIEPGEH